jgi:VWFA-related protein
MLGWSLRSLYESASFGPAGSATMRILSAILALLVLPLPALATTQVTVAQLQQTLAATLSTPDTALADQISNLELTQRLSPATLTRLQSSLPGEKSAQQLSILADQSAFLDLPPDEIPSLPAPDPATQRQIMSQVVAYVTKSIRQLPNFLATRETHSFEDRPADPYFSALPLHLTDRFRVSVLYRDGKEVDTTAKGKKAPAPPGLISWGEFGPILTTVLLDAAKSQLAWSHWEQAATGPQAQAGPQAAAAPVAVFRYAVPGKKSQYHVQMCGVGVGELNCEGTPTGYHGEMAVDPSTGAILRLTVIADLEPGSSLVLVSSLTAASIMVEYGPVDIGGKTYICPVHSVAIARRRVVQAHHGIISAAAMDNSPIQTLLNQVAFTQYHVYRGETRILTEDEEASQLSTKPSQAVAENPAAPAEPASSAPAQVAEVPKPAGSTDSSSSAGSQISNLRPADEPPAAAAVPPAPPSQPAAAVAETPAPAPAEPAPAPVDIPTTSVFRTTARQVLVDVVVSKKNGDSVPNLSQQDFSVDEDGKPQSIDFFEEHDAAVQPQSGPPAIPALPSSAVTNVPPAAPSSALNILLLDTLNTEPQDQVYVHQQILGFLRKMDPGTQVAIFSLDSKLRFLQGFTSDRASLLAAVNGNAAQRDAMAQTRSDNADDAQHTANLTAMRSAAPALAGLARGGTPQGYSFGARAAMTFEAINALARYLEGIPGRKNLIWFASSFPVFFFPTAKQLEEIRKNPELAGYAGHVKQTADLLTLSKIAVYPVSGAGVMTSNIGAADSAGAGSAGGTGHFGTTENAPSSLTSESLGFASALTGMEQLAASTGGRAFTTNDIDNAVRRIVHDSNVYYTVGYAPSGSAPDGSFRRIEVKVSGGKYKLAYRQGYNADSATTGAAAVTNAAPAENPITPLLQLGLPSATGILYGASAQRVPGNQPPTSDATPAGQNPNLAGPLTRYSVSFTIRAQDVSFGQAPNGERVAKLLIGVKAYAADGAALNWQATREAVELDPAHYQSALKSGIPVTLDIDLPANTPAQLVTAVYDWNTTRSGTLQLPLHP